MQGLFHSPDGDIWWDIEPNGNGTTFWFISGLPADCGAYEIPCGQSQVVQEGQN